MKIVTNTKYDCEIIDQSNNPSYVQDRIKQEVKQKLTVAIEPYIIIEEFERQISLEKGTEFYFSRAYINVYSNSEINEINDYLKCLEGCGVDIVVDKIKQILNK